MRMFSLAILALTIGAASPQVSRAQGYYNRTVVRNRLTGRQQIVDAPTARGTGAGQGGFSFDPRSGSLQVTAVARDRFTGRLQYYNEYINPWTGARYTTATQFNPFTGQYETVRNFLPPPTEEIDAGEQKAETAGAPLPKRGIRVIETKMPESDVPPEVAPALESPASSSDSTQRKPPVELKIHPPKVP